MTLRVTTFDHSDEETLPDQLKDEDNVSDLNITYWTRFTEKSNFVFVSAFQEIVCTEKIRRMEPILNLISSELRGLYLT